MSLGTVFVTGGSGFVGRTLIPALRARGSEVRALARTDASAAIVTSLGATPVRGDLDDPRALREAMHGTQLVIHAAAFLAEWGPRKTFEQINVEGTRSVLAAARDAGIPRLVFFSSNAVVLDGTPIVRVDETRPASRRAYPRYCATKAAAEALVVAANSTALQTVAVRPAMIWGSDVMSTTAEFVRAAQGGRWLWIDDGRHLISTCHVTNVVHGVLCAAERGRGGEAYYLTDGEPIVFREFATRVLASQGVTIEAKRISSKLVRPIASTVEFLWDTLRLPGRPPVTRVGFAMAGAELTFVDTKARREIGYAPSTTVEAGLAELERLGPASQERK